MALTRAGEGGMPSWLAKFKSREDVVRRDEAGREQGRIQYFDLRGVDDNSLSAEEKEQMEDAVRRLKEKKARGERVPRLVKITPENLEQLIERNRNRYNFIQDQPTVTLSSGARMPLIGLGTWKSKPGEIKQAVVHALRAGYRHIDCAEYYKNEHEVGQALSLVFAEGFVKREEVFLTSKLWNTNHAAADARRATQEILANLQVDYLDLLLIHWPVTGNTGPTLSPPIEETWREMERLVDDGLVKSIGVSNHSRKKLEHILSYARIPPAVNQVEGHPYWRQDDMIRFCREKGIHMTAYSPLGSPDSQSMFRRDGPKLMDDPTVMAVAEKLGRSVAQCLIRWAVQRGVSTLPKSVNEGRIASNIDVFGWQLPTEDFQALSSIARQQRMVDGSYFLHPKGPYKTMQDLWDEE